MATLRFTPSATFFSLDENEQKLSITDRSYGFFLHIISFLSSSDF